LHTGAVQRRRETRLFLIAVALHGLAYLFLLPAWMGEDEPWQFEYASHVADGYLPFGGKPIVGGPKAPYDERANWPLSVLQVRRRFRGLDEPRIDQRERQILRSMGERGFYSRVDWTGAEKQRTNFDAVAPDFTATSQQPGYYLLCGAWIAASRAQSVEGRLFAARTLSWVLYVVTAWIGLLFARRVFDDPSLALCAAVCIAWIPMHARQAALVNNDVLVRTLSALVLLLCARQVSGEARRSELAIAFAVAGATLFVKSNAVGAMLVLMLTVLARMRAVANRGRAIAFVLGGLVFLAAAVWVWHTQHSPVVPRTIAGFVDRVTRGVSAATWRETWTTLVGSFDWYSRPMGTSIYLAAALFGVLALAGAITAVVKRPSGVSRAQLLLCFAAVAAQLALVVGRGVGHGRYLMPAVTAFGALCVAGLVAPLPQRWRPRAALAFCALLVAYDAVFLWNGLVPNEYLVWGS
jgi:hypothetical protein